MGGRGFGSAARGLVSVGRVVDFEYGIVLYCLWVTVSPWRLIVGCLIDKAQTDEMKRLAHQSLSLYQRLPH